MANLRSFAALLLIILISLAQNTEAGIFVLDRSAGTVTEYSTSDLNKKASYQIPKDLFFAKSAPESGYGGRGLLVSASGRILFFNDVSAPDVRTTARKLWYFTGSKEYRAEITMEARCVPNDDRCLARDVFSTPALDAYEDAFYWWVNRVADFKDGEPASVKTDFDLYRGRFSDGGFTKERVAGFSFDECECTTGVCEESCPSGAIESERSGITGFIDVAHTVRGQLNTTVGGHTYFLKKGAGWIRTETDLRLKKPFLRTEEDGGCCGWANEGSDRLILVDGVKETVIYDEWKRFNNMDYDISFFTASAQLSPDLKKAAYTITTDSFSADQFRKSGTVRLSLDGKDNPEELKRVKQLIDMSPFIEVMPLDKKNGAVTIKKAEFAGWLDDTRILILKDGKLAIYDTVKRELTGTPLGAASVDDVFVVR